MIILVLLLNGISHMMAFTAQSTLYAVGNGPLRECLDDPLNSHSLESRLSFKERARLKASKFAFVVLSRLLSFSLGWFSSTNY